MSFVDDDEKEETMITLETMLAIMTLEADHIYTREEMCAQGVYPESRIPSRCRIVSIEDSDGPGPITLDVEAV